MWAVMFGRHGDDSLPGYIELTATDDDVVRVIGGPIGLLPRVRSDTARLLYLERPPRGRVVVDRLTSSAAKFRQHPPGEIPAGVDSRAHLDAANSDTHCAGSWPAGEVAALSTSVQAGDGQRSRSGARVGSAHG
jgi:hypothetical protein